jgi:hypothetical protein
MVGGVAEYGARCAELEKILEDLQSKASEEERRGGPPVVLAEYVSCKAGLTAYYEWRDRALNDCLAYAKAEASATEQTQHEKWSNYFSQKQQEAGRVVGDIASRHAEILKQTFNRLALEEQAFFQILAELPLARFQGRARQATQDLVETAKELNDRWRELVGLEERADGQIAALRVQILELFRNRVTELRGWKHKLEELGTFVLRLVQMEDKAEPDPEWTEPFDPLLQLVRLMKPSLDELTERALPLYAQERVVHELIEKNRLVLKEHLDQVNKESMARLYSDALRAAQDKVDRCSSDAQKQDARRLVEKLVRETEVVADDYDAAFDRFCSEMSGRFVGRISPENVELMVEQEFFNQFWKDVQDLDLPARFREISEQVTRLESIRLDGMNEVRREKVKFLLRSYMYPLKEEIQRLDSNAFSRLKAWFDPYMPTRKELKEKLENMGGRL